MSDLEKSTVYLLQHEGIFYASLLMQMLRIPTENLETAGVTIQNGRMVLYWNPKFFEKLTLVEARAVLEHELLHLCMDHISRKRDRDHYLFNVAADCAINQMIQGLPKGCITLDSFPAEWKMPEKASAEVYYSIITKNADKIEVKIDCDCDQEGNSGSGQSGSGSGNSKKKDQKGNKGEDKEGDKNKDSKDDKNKEGNGSGGQENKQPQQGPTKQKRVHVTIKDSKGNVKKEFHMDDDNNPGNHGEWTKGDSADVAKEVVRQAVQQAVDEVRKSQGREPAGLEEYIKELLKPPVLPWQAILRKFVAYSIKAGKKYSWKRPNRRFNEDQKGKLPKRQLALTIAIDTSGSIDVKEFQKFMVEIYGIMNSYKSTITMIECDAEVQKEYKLAPYGKVDCNFKGRGGTDFKPVFKYIEDHRIRTDALIFFTDMYGDFGNKKPSYPVLWVSTTDVDTAPFGSVLPLRKHQPDDLKRD